MRQPNPITIPVWAGRSPKDGDQHEKTLIRGPGSRLQVQTDPDAPSAPRSGEDEPRRLSLRGAAVGGGPSQRITTGHDPGESAGEEIVAAKFELYKDKSGQYRFRLKAGNGEIIASSESYKTKASARNGIESVKTNAPNAVVDDQT